jgi:hypothetical protein
MSWEPQIITLYLFGAAMIILLAVVFILERKIAKLLKGKNASSLEEVINSLGRDVKDVEQVNDLIKKHLTAMEERLHRSIQHVKTIRFNPFRDQGSNQSFTTAFLDEDGNGVVISSLYSRDRVSIYAKPVNRYTSTYELSEEEKAVLER